MSNNSHRNGTHCVRCIGGTLIRDGADALCILCGWRYSTERNQKAAQLYLSEAIVARLLHNGNGDMDDIQPKHIRMAGMAK